MSKLVRDKIPQIIENNGKTCRSRIMEQEEYIRALEEKLTEELAEYQESKALEELADLLEVMEATVKARGYTWAQLLELKDAKKAARGGFEDRILLITE